MFVKLGRARRQFLKPAPQLVNESQLVRLRRMPDIPDPSQKTSICCVTAPSSSRYSASSTRPGQSRVRSPHSRPVTRTHPNPSDGEPHALAYDRTSPIHRRSCKPVNDPYVMSQRGRETWRGCTTLVCRPDFLCSRRRARTAAPPRATSPAIFYQLLAGRVSWISKSLTLSQVS